MSARPTLSLFPTQQSLSDAIDRFASGSGDVSGMIPGMMTIGAFENKLALEILGDRKTISAFGRGMLMAKVLHEYYRRHSDGIFSAALRFKGFADAMLSFFDELGAGLVAPERLKKIKGYAPGKEAEIAGLYEAYHHALSQLGLSDTGVIRGELIKSLDDPLSFAFPTLNAYSELRLIDIYQFTPYRFELFRKLAKRLPVIITAPAPDERRKAFGFIVNNLARFESLGEHEQGITIEYEQAVPCNLSPLQSRIFDLSPVGEDSGAPIDSVKILQCVSRYREIEEAGMRIRKSLDDPADDSALSDFALVFRDFTAYAPIIEDVFRRYAIPFYFKKGVRLKLNPLIKSVLAIFDSIDSDFARDNVLRIIGSPYFRRFAGLDIGYAQKLCLAAGIIDGQPGEWRGKLGKAVEEAEPWRKSSAQYIHREIVDLLSRIDNLRNQNRAPEFFNAVTDFLQYLDISPEPPQGIPMAELMRYRDHNAFTQLLETIYEAKEAVEHLNLKSANLGFDRIRDLFFGQLETRHVPEPATVDLNRVAVLNAHDAVGARFRHLYICGLTEGEFPRFPEARAILNENERALFNELHAKTLPRGQTYLARGRAVFDRAMDKWQEESLLFYQALKSASDDVTFTYSVQELDGNPLLRSQFIDDVLDTLAPGAVGKDRESLVTPIDFLAVLIDDPSQLIDPDEINTRILKDIFAEDASEKSVTSQLAGIAAGNQWDRFRRLLDLAIIERGRDRYFFEPSMNEKMKLADRFSGVIKNEIDYINRIIAIRDCGRYSPTDLEKFGQCPFRYFAGRLLKLDPVEEPSLTMDAMGAGSMVHNVFERFYEHYIREGGLPLRGAETEKLEEIANLVFADYEARGETGDRDIWRVEKQKTLIWLRKWLENEVEDQAKNRFIPVAVEPAFDIPEKVSGGQKAYPPLRMKTPLGERLIVGRIDRIDVNRAMNSARVIDYKNSSNTQKYRSMVKRENMGEISFQPPIYMMMAREYVLSKGLLPKVDKLYAGYNLVRAKTHSNAFVATDKKSAQVDDGVFLSRIDDAAEKENTFEHILLGVVDRIENGLFPVAPKSCEYCDFAGLCRHITAPYEEGSEE